MFQLVIVSHQGSDDSPEFANVFRGLKHIKTTKQFDAGPVLKCAFKSGRFIAVPFHCDGFTHEPETPRSKPFSHWLNCGFR